MMFHDHDMTGWGYAGMATSMILFWILIIAGIIAAIRLSSRSACTRTAPAAPANPPPTHPDKSTPSASSAHRSTKPSSPGDSTVKSRPSQ